MINGEGKTEGQSARAHKQKGLAKSRVSIKRASPETLNKWGRVVGGGSVKNVKQKRRVEKKKLSPSVRR